MLHTNNLRFTPVKRISIPKKVSPLYSQEKGEKPNSQENGKRWNAWNFPRGYAFGPLAISADIWCKTRFSYAYCIVAYANGREAGLLNASTSKGLGLSKTALHFKLQIHSEFHIPFQIPRKSSKICGIRSPQEKNYIDICRFWFAVIRSATGATTGTRLLLGRLVLWDRSSILGYCRSIAFDSVSSGNGW